MALPADAALSIRDQVYQFVLQSILERRLRPGERLFLDDLAGRFQVSRTPVQFALSRLAGEGLVEPAGRRGYVVTVPTAQTLLNLYDVRLMCETYALANGVGHADRAFVAEQRELAHRCAQLTGSHDPAERLAAASLRREFHRRVVALQGNPSLTDIYARLNVHMHALQLGLDLMARDDRRRDRDLRDHLALCDAIEAGDADEAVAIARRHILDARNYAISQLEPPELTAAPGHQEEESGV